ncbi:MULTISPECIES: hypothetical protein [unclassified Pseudomonas]|uniref:hypothetical protein n=1 Tax=unclassified Pseudomonas TaxID=196821 RepID=UPI001CBEC96A|nr:MULTISPECIES: hypothetical protein [unclassified Pseudomonas]
MAKSNAEIQKDKRAKEKTLLERIGAERRSLIVLKALADALQVLGERHAFEKWQETESPFLINIAAGSAKKSARFFANTSRPEIVVTENQSRQIDQFKKSATVPPLFLTL